MAKKLKHAEPRHFIRAWRKHRSMTQQQLADRIGISREYVSMIEKGRRRYDQTFLEAAAEAMRCDVADLIMRDPAQPGMIWSIWDQIPPERRSLAIDVLQGMIPKTGTKG
jgi:transcriptional regulator with XRE-family HTH domain